MAITITMPQLGETVTEGTILSWVKQIGERVGVDEIIVEISTDKVDTEVPSPASGILSEILVGAGETVAVGTALAVLTEDSPASEQSDAQVVEETPEPAAPISTPDATAASVAAAIPAQPDATPTEPQPVATQVPESDGSRRSVLSPVVRKLAADNDIDVAMVRGTGEGGRISRKDIEVFISNRQGASGGDTSEAPVAEPVPQAPSQSSAPTPVAPVQVATTQPVPVLGSGDIQEISRLRGRIAANMVKAKQTAAHVWTSVEVDYERVTVARMAHRGAFKDAEGFSLTYLPFIVRATVDALAAYPAVNSLFDIEAGTHTFSRSVHLGIAVDLDQKGLVVPTVKDADAMTLKGAARAIRSVAARARSNKLLPDDLAGSTFSITNPGPFGSFMSAPIINVPNSAILSTDTVVKRPIVVEMPDGSDAIGIHHVGYLGLSWDHRVFDGSTAVLFLNRIKTNLETWDWEQELS